jgi:hypothetical protein
VEDPITDLVIKACIYMDMPEEQCSGMVKAYIPTVVNPFYERYFNEDLLCVYTGSCDEPTIVYHNFTDWAEKLLSEKPTVNCDEEPGKWDTTLKFAQIADNHFDFRYSEGTNAKCGKWICCRESDGRPAKPEDMAEYWGSYT